MYCFEKVIFESWSCVERNGVKKSGEGGEGREIVEGGEKVRDVNFFDWVCLADQDFDVADRGRESDAEAVRTNGFSSADASKGVSAKVSGSTFVCFFLIPAECL
jgi:hypothetical protein